MNATMPVLAAVAALSLTGCVTGGETASSATSSAPDRECSTLTETRRKLTVQIEAVESGRVGPGTFTSVVTTLAVFGAPSYQMGALGSTMAKDRANALDEMRTKQTALSEQIDEKQCTAAARAKTGAIQATDSTQYDGTYSGQGQTDSWCAQPLVALKLASGHVSGTLRSDSKGSETYDIMGQVYNDGALTLEFMRPKSRHYTDDFDGSLKDGVLSFTAKLDLSPKACVYRFAVQRRA